MCPVYLLPMYPVCTKGYPLPFQGRVSEGYISLRRARLGLPPPERRHLLTLRAGDTRWGGNGPLCLLESRRIGPDVSGWGGWGESTALDSSAPMRRDLRMTWHGRRRSPLRNGRPVWRRLPDARNSARVGGPTLSAGSARGARARSGLESARSPASGRPVHGRSRSR